MSYFDYIDSITASKYAFYTLIMAAMRNADTDNLEKLKDAFPRVWEELEKRYDAPGGYLPNER